VRSLFAKAQNYRQEKPRLRLVRPDELGMEDDREISAEDRQKIMSQIEGVLAESRMAVTPETLLFTPRKRGALLPVLVNLAAVAVLAAGIYLALLFSQRDEQAIVAPAPALQTAEGKLLETMKEESRQQLAGKDREIAGIREKLAGFDAEKEKLRQEADLKLQSREKELQEDLARTLEAERKRLSDTGLAADAVERKVAELEARTRANLDANLAALRRQAESERAERERTIDGLKAEYQKSLSAAQGERSRLQEEASRKQSELEAGYRQKEMALEQDKAKALEEIDRLKKQEEREQMVLDQLLSFYRKAREEIQASRLDQARAILTEMRRYLDDASVAALPGIANRRTVELFLIGSLEELVSQKATKTDGDASVQTLVASANLITAVAGLVQQGDALFQEQDYVRARDLYLAAMARIPAVQTGTAKLTEIERIFAERQRKETAGILAAAGDAYRAGNYPQAVERYGKALEGMQMERGSVDALLAQLKEIGARTMSSSSRDRLAALDEDARERARILARLEALRGSVAGASSGGAEVDRKSLIALLEAKLTVQQVLLSQEVLTRYPDLYEKMDNYLEALVAEKRSEAQQEALRDLYTLLARLIAKGGNASTEGLLAGAAPGSRDLLQGILEKLRILVR